MAAPLRGVVLAGGSGTRLLPLTAKTSKHMLPVGAEPMIAHPIRKLVEAEVREILVVTSPAHAGAMFEYLGAGSRFACEISFRVQERAGGIADALSLARSFARGGSMAVILGDNIFETPLGPFADAFRAQAIGARVLLKPVPDPERFGIAEVEGARVVRIVEKPARPASNLCVTGIYFYHPDVFDVIGRIRPSARGELEISDVNQAYAERGDLAWDELPGWWIDAGTHESLAAADRLVSGTRK